MRVLINSLLFLISINIFELHYAIGAPQCEKLPDIGRIDCHADGGATQESCVKRGCCWKVPEPINGKIPKEIPYCVFPQNYVGYKIASVNHSPGNTQIVIRREIPSGFRNDIYQVYVHIIEYHDKVRIKIYDPETGRYKVPLPKLDIIEHNKLKESLYNVNVTFDGEIKIMRKSTHKVIFHTNLHYLIYSDQFLQLTTSLPSNYIYGLGEHKDIFRKSVTWKHYTMFNADTSPNSHGSDFHLYGDHPFSMTVEDDEGNSNGMFLFNSNAMDVILSPIPSLTYRTIGGIFDIFIFFGPEPQEVIRQYQYLIGLPMEPPYWSLGFHLCRYGYNTLSNVEATLKRNVDAGIPIDTQWIDIDVMSKGDDFTFNNKTFSGLPKFVNQLHADGRKHVAMVDCGIGVEPKGTYPPYDDGIKEDIFIKNASGQILIGKVWNKEGTVFPDFTNPKTLLYWTEQYKRYHKQVPFDGIWNDMNEPSNFVDGSKNGCPESHYENPQYVPGNQKLNSRTLCMTAQQYAGLHYNLHNLYGFTEIIASNHALKQMNKRPFIISRSTFPGLGHYGGHWSGDIFSNWDTLRWSIASTFNFNMFGIPMMGSDICGFIGNTNVELCARWSALGAFYPFSRNHNDYGHKDQDPAALGPTVIAAAKSSLLIRYQLLPYLYTLFRNAHTKGDTIFRPLFFEFPKDKTSYTIETQFMWGNGLMIIPTVEEHATNVTAYIPPGKWYNYIKSTPIESKGMKMTFDSPLTAPPVVLIRGGHIIPSQEAKQTTTESRKSKFTLHVALNQHEEAIGNLFWDDADLLGYDPKYRFNTINFNAKNGTLNIDHTHFAYMVPMVIDKVMVYGVAKEPMSVTTDGHSLNHIYDKNLHKLQINHIDIDMSKKFSVIWK